MASTVNIKGRLFGNSMFWIFTRVKDNIEVSKPVCILKKMPDSQRVFCVFGQMVERTGSMAQQNYKRKDEDGNNQMNFKFFKNQEIPEFFYSLEKDQFLKGPEYKAIQEDYVDINVTLIDNGDEKLCL